jgi:hypothetical protein
MEPIEQRTEAEDGDEAARKAFGGAVMAEEPLEMLTIYKDPTDYPGRFVVRRYLISRGQVETASSPMAIVTTLEEARAAVQAERPGLVCLSRVKDDDPVIVESWL